VNPVGATAPLPLPLTTLITVSVRLYATLRAAVPGLGLGEAITVQLPSGSTVDSLVGRLNLPQEQVKIIFVNNHVRPGETVLNDGDRVGIFPPVGGG